MKIELRLLSDTCAASGLGAFGGVDTDITIDEYGLPIIPAKRLKGCLREEGLEIVSVLPESENVFNKLFGKAGDALPGLLYISDGELKNAETLKYEIKSGPLSPKQVTELFTSLRTGMAMYGDGIIRQSDDNTLRTMRVMNKSFGSNENTFYFSVKELDNDSAEFLKKCCQSLRGVGSARTRGLGEINCRLIDSHDEKTDDHNERTASYDEGFISGVYQPRKINDSGAMFVHYTLTLTSATIISALDGRLGGCEESISGSYILGVYANAWIKANKDCSQPHENPDFKRIFLEGGVKFLPAYPANNEQDKTLYPSPRCIRTDKDGLNAIDCCVEDAPDEYVNTLKGFAWNGRHLAGVKKTVEAHHARPYDKSVGHTLENGSLSKGAFYNYDSLAKGQIFMGTIVGSESDLEVIRKLAKREVNIGKSRTAQYGNVVFAWEEYSSLRPNPITIAAGEEFRVVLRSPVVLTDGFGTTSIDPNMMGNIFGDKIIIKRTFCSGVTIGGYNSKWLLPRTQVQAIAAGSVIVFKNTGESSLSLDNEQFIGLHTGEGFGHVFLEKLPAAAAVRLQTATINMASIPGENNGLLENFIKKQKAHSWIQRKAIIEAAKQGDVRNSQLGRLRTYLSRVDSFSNLAVMLSFNNWKQDRDRKYIQIFCMGEAVSTNKELREEEREQENIRMIKDKLEKAAKNIHHNTYLELLSTEELFHWYKTYLIMLIRYATKEKPEGDAS